MRLAIIDLGTNSIRFDVHEISQTRAGEAQTRRLYREKAMVRLGQDLFRTGKLSAESKRRTLEALISYRKTLDALQVDECIAFGTAALRDASDGQAFVAQVKKKAGIQMRVISGAEEAALIARGVLSNEELPYGNFALIDIGGGSTEISICKNETVLFADSFNLGVAKLQQVFLDQKKPAIQDLRKFIRNTIAPIKKLEKWPKIPYVLGSSGTVAALSKLIYEDREMVCPFESKYLSQLIPKLKSKTPSQLLSLPGMEPKRVDLIFAGALLLEELAQILGAKIIDPTEFSLRDGILEDQLDRFQKMRPQSSQFSLEHLKERAIQWGANATHLNSVQEKSEWLFDRLKSTHQLPKQWKKYLSAAAILHDVGETISYSQHTEHSEYMVQHANFVGMHPWETQLISQLCRHHKEERLLEKKLERKIPYDKKDELRTVFLKLLSLLMLADALDRTHRNHLTLTSARSSGKTITLHFRSKGTADLEILRFEQKKTLFESLFKKTVLLKRGTP